MRKDFQYYQFSQKYIYVFLAPATSIPSERLFSNAAGRIFPKNVIICNCFLFC
uniref:Uncharacterized protein n=1 Tax=Rhizophagus irregularis (strain DAOM 181602 / DAOM 197198 / MUCL 43194) TaxID=747089 RepID=U9TTU1_RHIID